MFSYQIRHETQQKIRVGVLLTRQTKLTDPLNPISGAQLSWYYWKYIVKADETIVNIGTHVWADIPGCAGLYYLTLTSEDTNKLGSLVLYINDSVSLGRPILMYFEVIVKNVYDAKFGSDLLKVEPGAQKF